MSKEGIKNLITTPKTAVVQTSNSKPFFESLKVWCGRNITLSHGTILAAAVTFTVALLAIAHFVRKALREIDALQTKSPTPPVDMNALIAKQIQEALAPITNPLLANSLQAQVTALRAQPPAAAQPAALPPDFNALVDAQVQTAMAPLIHAAVNAAIPEVLPGKTVQQIATAVLEQPTYSDQIGTMRKGLHDGLKNDLEAFKRENKPVAADEVVTQVLANLQIKGLTAGNIAHQVITSKTISDQLAKLKSDTETTVRQMLEAQKFGEVSQRLQQQFQAEVAKIPEVQVKSVSAAIAKVEQGITSTLEQGLNKRLGSINQRLMDIQNKQNRQDEVAEAQRRDYLTLIEVVKSLNIDVKDSTMLLQAMEASVQGASKMGYSSPQITRKRVGRSSSPEQPPQTRRSLSVNQRRSSVPDAMRYHSPTKATIDVVSAATSPELHNGGHTRKGGHTRNYSAISVASIASMGSTLSAISDANSPAKLEDEINGKHHVSLLPTGVPGLTPSPNPAVKGGSRNNSTKSNSSTTSSRGGSSGSSRRKKRGEKHSLSTASSTATTPSHGATNSAATTPNADQEHKSAPKANGSSKNDDPNS